METITVKVEITITKEVIVQQVKVEVIAQVETTVQEVQVEIAQEVTIVQEETVTIEVDNVCLKQNFLTKMLKNKLKTL